MFVKASHKSNVQSELRVTDLDNPFPDHHELKVTLVNEQEEEILGNQI